MQHWRPVVDKSAISATLRPRHEGDSFRQDGHLGRTGSVDREAREASLRGSQGPEGPLQRREELGCFLGLQLYSNQAGQDCGSPAVKPAPPHLVLKTWTINSTSR